MAIPPPNPTLFQNPTLKALLGQLREGVILAHDENNHICEANPQALELLNQEADACRRLSISSIVPHGQREILEAILDLTRGGNEPKTYSGYLNRAGDRPFPAEMRIQHLQIEDSGYYLITFQDVSDRIRAMEEIELRNIAIANVTSGVTVADARQPDLPLIYVNQGFQEITGYTARESVGRSCRFLQGEDREQPDLDILREALRKGEPCVVRLRNYRKDGTLFHNELHISPVRNDLGELTHFVGIQLDVTEQVKARESLERSERQVRKALEQEKELNGIKTRFISMVSHEFRTPMTGLQASAAFLRKYGETIDAEKRARHLANIEISLKRMNRLLDDVLFFSRAESDKLKVSLTPVCMDEYMPRLAESMMLIHPQRKIQSDCQIEHGRAFLLDEHLLDHILQNLIGNAIKYSNGEEPVLCRAEETPDHLLLTVQDHGIGIPEADQARLFEAFHRAANVGTRQGTGLGLNIALRAVELLDGEIHFTSQENSGSTFSVRIPKKIP